MVLRLIKFVVEKPSKQENLPKTGLAVSTLLRNLRGSALRGMKKIARHMHPEWLFDGDSGLGTANFIRFPNFLYAIQGRFSLEE